MSESKSQQLERINRYAAMIAKQAGKAIRPYRADGYINLLSKYGTSKDSSEHTFFAPEATVPDDVLAMTYEGNGLFARIIDLPAEEAVKHGFSLKGVSDQALTDFCYEALDELDWEETAMTGVKWSRLFGGAIGVMLINDGRGLEEPLDWKNIKSIDDIRLYDRSVVVPDYTSMYTYKTQNPFSTRGSRLGMPELYYVSSRYGNFAVHESRCLVFQNGRLPEKTTNSVYELWGVPEYIRIHRAMRDAETAHGNATKMLDKSIQAVYKMRDLAAELASEEGENRVLRRLQTIDMARGLLNTITVDQEGEDYDFRTFQFSGVSDVVDVTCNFLSALTGIPQTILFGRSPAGMNSTGESDMENYYNSVERIQKRMLRSNLRYLLSIIFQAGLATGEVDEIPKFNVQFNPLWSLSDLEQADLALKKAQTQQAKAAVAVGYINAQVLDPSEVRRKLADSDEFDIDTILDEVDLEDETALEQAIAEYEIDPAAKGGIAEQGQFAAYANAVDINKHQADPGTEGSAPASAPAATKLPQDMSEEELAKAAAAQSPAGKAAPHPAKSPELVETDGEEPSTPGKKMGGSVGVLVFKDGKILTGVRNNDFGHGLICGPGGHIEANESPIMAAARETQEEFGIIPTELIPIGRGATEPENGGSLYLFICTEYDGDPATDNDEMVEPKFRDMEELEALKPSLFAPFADSLTVLLAQLVPEESDENNADGEKISLDNPEKQATITVQNPDGGSGSGNKGHEGVPGARGGSAPKGASGLSKFQRNGDTMEITSDHKVKFGSATYTLKKGTVISGIEDFAGKGKERKIDVEEHLVAQVGGKIGEWSKTKGFADISLHRKKVTAELHWFEHPTEGQIRMKIKSVKSVKGGSE